MTKVVNGGRPGVDVAVDVGQSGVRARVLGATGTREFRQDAIGEGHPASVSALAATLGRAGLGPVVRLAVGATGVHGRADRYDASALMNALRPEQTIVADDGVTAHLGAIGARPGAVAAVGTGIVVVARRADGWMQRSGGHGLDIDDRGSGAWIGRKALQCAIDQREGVRADGAAVEEACRGVLGDLSELPWRAGRPDWPATLAALCEPLSELADAGDRVARGIFIEAGEQIGRRLAAAGDAAGLSHGDPVVITGGVSAAMRHLRPGIRRTVGDGVGVAAASGDPLDGAVMLLDPAVMLPDPPLVVRVHGEMGRSTSPSRTESAP